jgi:hypothetical protein
MYDETYELIDKEGDALRWGDVNRCSKNITSPLIPRTRMN